MVRSYRSDNYLKNAAIAFRNPPCDVLIGVLLAHGLAADTLVMGVEGGLSFRVNNLSMGRYVALTRDLVQAGFAYTHNVTRQVYVRVAH